MLRVPLRTTMYNVYRIIKLFIGSQTSAAKCMIKRRYMFSKCKRMCSYVTVASQGAWRHNANGENRITITRGGESEKREPPHDWVICSQICLTQLH